MTRLTKIADCDGGAWQCCLGNRAGRPCRRLVGQRFQAEAAFFDPVSGTVFTVWPFAVLGEQAIEIAA